MTVQHIEPTTAARDLRRQAVQVLADLLTEDLPEVAWRVRSINRFLHLYVSYPQDHDLLDGHARSYQDVREWAAHLGVEVHLLHGDTPGAHAVINGIGVRVWCAPRYRDDDPER